MNINDFLTGPPTRPDTPDFWRLSSIIMKLKADNDAPNFEEFEKRWRAHYEKLGDFDSFVYHAFQGAIQQYEIQTFGEYTKFMEDPDNRFKLATALQAWFDGFIMGAEFIQLGGHQD